MKSLRMGLVILLSVIATLTLQAQQIDFSMLELMKPRNIGPANMSGRVTAIDAVQSNPDIIYIGTASGGLWKSESGGIAWEPIFDNNLALSIGAVAVSQKNPSIVWGRYRRRKPPKQCNRRIWGVPQPGCGKKLATDGPGKNAQYSPNYHSPRQS